MASHGDDNQKPVVFYGYCTILNQYVSPTIQDIFRQHFPAYAQHHPLPFHYHKMAKHLIQCRTAKLGGHSLYCENGHLDGVWYNSCRHRCCPQCSGIGRIRWVEKHKARFLNHPHQHLVFSIPHEYLTYWKLNRRQMIDVLFKAVKETLQTLLVKEPDKKYLDAIPGYVLFLHTWGRNLSLHPHIHCLVSEGGLNKEGKWVKAKHKRLLPAKVLMLIFRGKFNDFMRQAGKQVGWQFPENAKIQHLINLTNKLGRKKWQVYIKPAFQKMDRMLTYLVNYLKGGAIKNQQIQDIRNNQIKIRYYAHKDNPDGRKTNVSVMSLSPDKFFQRYLQHIPPVGKASIRQYGLYANGSRKKLNQAREQLGQQPLADPTKDKEDTLSWDECLDVLPDITAHKTCDVCGCPLTIKRALPFDYKENKSRSPP